MNMPIVRYKGDLWFLYKNHFNGDATLIRFREKNNSDLPESLGPAVEEIRVDYNDVEVRGVHGQV